MRKPKYYFRHHGDEVAYTLDSWFDIMRFEGIKILVLLPAKKQKVPGFIWCNDFQEVTENGNCGKVCPSYSPRNGKSGICKHQGMLLEPNGEKVIITLP